MKSEYSFQEAWEILKISKGTLYNRLNEHKHLINHTKTMKGKRYITHEGLQKLRELDGNLNDNSTDDQTSVHDFYIDQIKIKDKQIETLQDRIKELTDQLKSMNENLSGNRELFNALIDSIKDSHELNKNNQILLRQALPEPKKINQDMPEQKKSFLDRLFRKKADQ